MNTTLFRSGIPCALMATFVTGMCFSGGRFWFGIVMAALAVVAWSLVAWILWRGFVVVLLLALPAYAAPLPPMPAIPTVTRQAPLLSPKAASVPKTTPMFIPASSSLPRIPMMVEIAPASDGRITLIVDALKPANTPMTFEYATFATGPWEPLFSWSAYPEQQWVGIAWTTSGDSKFVRATYGGGAFQPVSAMPRPVPQPGVVVLPPSKTKPKRLH